MTWQRPSLSYKFIGDSEMVPGIGVVFVSLRGLIYDPDG